MIREDLEQLEARLLKVFSEAKLERTLDHMVMWVEPDRLVETMTRLRDDDALNFKQMMDLTAVHYPKREAPLEIVYQLLSVYRNQRLRVKMAVPDGAMIPTVTGIWSCANWYERETYEMFGVLFKGHPDLRRLLTEYDSEDYPLRKEFPLCGHYDVFYDEKQRRVVRKPVELPRESREPYSRKRA
ncbi:MAG: NADH-quinone oxidoreductase subunit C [Magnetococcales bacterium]|nr:NADH-quinone oxidoreductase subunit C [Magnetococcales bacterium]